MDKPQPIPCMASSQSLVRSRSRIWPNSLNLDTFGSIGQFMWKLKYPAMSNWPVVVAWCSRNSENSSKNNAGISLFFVLCGGWSTTNSLTSPAGDLIKLPQTQKTQNTEDVGIGVRLIPSEGLDLEVEYSRFNGLKMVCCNLKEVYYVKVWLEIRIIVPSCGLDSVYFNGNT